MATTPKTKDRWDFRVTPAADRVVRQAAQETHRSLTDFVVEAAVVAAERVLADRTRFVLDEDSWKRFIALLDRPAQDNKGLRKLLSAPDVFE